MCQVCPGVLTPVCRQPGASMEAQYPRGEIEALGVQVPIISASIVACRWTFPWVVSFALEVTQCKSKVAQISIIVDAQLSDRFKAGSFREQCAQLLQLFRYQYAHNNCGPIKPSAFYESPRKTRPFPGDDWSALSGLIPVSRTLSSLCSVQNSQSRQQE